MLDVGCWVFFRQPACKFHGLLRRVALKSIRVFDDFRRIGKIIECEKMKLSAKDGADFPDLVGVARGDEQRRHISKLAEIFPLASLTRIFLRAKSNHEIT